MTLPPGQRAVDGFPRFGTHLHRPPPPIPAESVIEVGGVLSSTVMLPVSELADLPRRELTADFHCVAGWSATGLRWEGVAFETFYRELIAPHIDSAVAVSHVVFGGLDGYRSVVRIEDAMEPDVLVADRLNDRPLDPDHGAPVRLVSPGQYGFVSTKHLCRIEVETAAPARPYRSLPLVVRGGLRLVTPHPRARVWSEERHRHLPGWAVRPVYRLLIGPIRTLAARAGRGSAPGRGRG